MSAAINHYDVIEQFKDFILSFGVQPPDTLTANGTIQKFKINGKDKGRYCLHLDGLPAGWFQDWSNGERQNWTYQNDEFKPKPLTREQLAQQLKDRETRKANTEKEKATRHAAAAKTAAVIWKNSEPIGSNESHPYLVRKGVKGVYGVRVNHYKGGNDLIIPLGKHGELKTLQFIKPIKPLDRTTDKLLLKNGDKSGCHFILNKTPHPKIIGIAEGLATIASVLEDNYSQKIGIMGVMAVDAGNLEAVALIMRNKHPHATIIIFGDIGDTDRKGEKSARAAAVACGGFCVWPPIPKGDFNDYLTGGNVTTSLEALLNEVMI
jgi:putative DNA primase/helicase